jgi:hypothetical protein
VGASIDKGPGNDRGQFGRALGIGEGARTRFELYALSRRGPGYALSSARIRKAGGETDCMAGVVGYELRCAERKIISLRCRVSSDSGAPAETAAVPRENAVLDVVAAVFLEPSDRAVNDSCDNGRDKDE